jgi:hypothetical protein
MGHKPRPKFHQCNCEERLEAWHKFSLFGGIIGIVPEDVQPEIWGACLGYMIRRLSHRQVPVMELVQDTLNGKLPVPPCGFIGCNWDAEHVH